MYEIWKFSPDHFYDENFQFYDKKNRFSLGMEISSETTIPEISSETTILVISSETAAQASGPYVRPTG